MNQERVYAINVVMQDIDKRSKRKPQVALFFEHGKDKEEAITRLGLESKFNGLKNQGEEAYILQVYEVEVKGYNVLLRKRK